MNDIASPSFRKRLVEALDANEGFRAETRWFDGSILLEIGSARCWLKVYCGRVIEALDFIPPLGFTFKIAGSTDAWESLVHGRRVFADLITPGRRDFRGDPALATADGSAAPDIRIEGNTMEASRILEALFHLAECVATSAA